MTFLCMTAFTYILLYITYYLYNTLLKYITHIFISKKLSPTEDRDFLINLCHLYGEHHHHHAQLS